MNEISMCNMRGVAHGVIIPFAVPQSARKNFQLIASDFSAQPHTLLILPPHCLQQVDVFIGKTQINQVYNNSPVQAQSQRLPA